MDASTALPLIEQIYRASLDTQQWQGVVQSLSDAYGGAPTGFALQLPGFPLSGIFFASDQFEERYRPTFIDHAIRGLPWEEARRHDFVGRFGLANEVISDAEIEASEFYRDWMQPQGLAPHGPIGHTIALEEGRPSVGLAIFVPAGREPFGEEDLAFGNLLVPHLALAYQIQTESRRHLALSDALDRFPTGVILLDARGHVLRRNSGAQQILARDDGLSEQQGLLRAALPEDDAALRESIEGAIHAACGDAQMLQSSQFQSISRRSDARPLSVLVSPLPARGVDPTLADALVVVYVANLDGGVLRNSHAVRKLYGLTEAEAHLVELLCQGCSLDEAADVRGVTSNTARSQLKQVFAKTHTSRQSELVRLVLSGVASIDGP